MLALTAFGCGGEDPPADTGATTTGADDATGTTGAGTESDADTGTDADTSTDADTTGSPGEDTSATGDPGDATGDPGDDTTGTGGQTEGDTTDDTDATGGSTDTTDTTDTTTTGGETGTDDTGTTDDGTTGDTGLDPCNVDPDSPECCEQEMACADITPFPVCDEGVEPLKDYLNDCFAFCDKGNYDNLEVFQNSLCNGDCPASCDETDSSKPPVCWVNPNDETDIIKYANLYLSCCDEHPFGDPNLVTASVTDDNQIECNIGGGGGNEECLAACGDEPAPICGTIDGTTLDYANGCIFACTKAAGEVVECDSPCEETFQCPQCAASGCAPVCGVDGTTYRNACYAGCQGGTSIEHQGSCCNCPDGSQGSEWCSAEGNQFDTLCDLQCVGQTPFYNGVCVEGCAPGPDDVDVCANKDGSFGKYPSFACAEADAATCIYEGDCSYGTNSCEANGETDYNPVCGTYLDPNTGQEATDTFANGCHAGCAGVFESDAGICADCTALCSTATQQAYCGVDDCVLYPDSCIPTKCLAIEDTALTKFACVPECSE